MFSSSLHTYILCCYTCTLNRRVKKEKHILNRFTMLLWKVLLARQRSTLILRLHTRVTMHAITVLQTLRVLKHADHVLLLSPALFLLSPALFVTPLFVLHFLLAGANVTRKPGGEPPTYHQRTVEKVTFVSSCSVS